ncbi:globin [Alteribacter natronophilus]|uniref:globin domain-containing protein n=1 Tax=Alteribacter natronophilus TaxID=2583810 RepID=UPI00110EDE40|nr:globin [Alteribacter natronophilus]TMW72937.1 globin [Alteribacter natronophilus]
MKKARTPYDLIGEQTLDRLVDAFYTNVALDPELAPLFPDDLTETARKQKQFLTQFLGGPPAYSEEHGHPMLRARHMPFPITPSRAEAWLRCMDEAMDETELEEPFRSAFMERLTQTARHMINTTE